MCLYPPSMGLIIPGYLHSDNDIALGSVWRLLIFHGRIRSTKKKREVEKFKTFKLN